MYRDEIGLRIYALFPPSSSQSSRGEVDCVIMFMWLSMVSAFHWVPSISPGQWYFAAVIKSLISSKLIAFPSEMNQPVLPTCFLALSCHSHTNIESDTS